MEIITVEEQLIVVGPNHRVRDELESLSGRWHPVLKCWTLPRSVESQVLLLRERTKIKKRCKLCRTVGHFRSECPKIVLYTCLQCRRIDKRFSNIEFDCPCRVHR